MTTETFQIQVSDLSVKVVRKDIKNLHIGVYPPDGEVRVAAPLNMNDESIRLAVITRLQWIRKQQKNFMRQEREEIRSMEQGESHFFEGRRYRLEIIEKDAPPTVSIKNKSRLTLSIRPGSSPQKRMEILEEWYRHQLKGHVTQLIVKWEAIIGVKVESWTIKKMKEKWGSCNPKDARISINLEMAKKPLDCLEYVVVHEITHLRERLHNEQFMSLMDLYLPDWRHIKEKLNSLPLGAYGYDVEHELPASPDLDAG